MDGSDRKQSHALGVRAGLRSQVVHVVRLDLGERLPDGEPLRYALAVGQQDLSLNGPLLDNSDDDAGVVVPSRRLIEGVLRLPGRDVGRPICLELNTVVVHLSGTAVTSVQ